MFRKKSLAKDTLREIRFSISRFLSIFAIVALGSGFFAGLKSTCPDMKETAHQFFIDQNLMDIKLMTTIGISAKDVSAVNRVDGVTGVMPSYTQDLFLNIDNENIVLKAISYNKNLKDDDIYNINKPVLLEGRMPEKSGECVVEIKLTSPKSFKIGNKITLSSPDSNKKISEYLKQDTFEIVGIVSSPSYIGYKRGSTNVGDGEIASFILLPEEDFNIPYYTELFATIEGLDELDPFSEEYKKKLNEYIPQIKTALVESTAKRYESLKENAENSLDKAKSDLENAEYLANADYDTLVADIKKGESALVALNKQYAEEEKAQNPIRNIIKSQIIQTQNAINLAKEKIDMINNGTLPSAEEIQKQMDGYKQQISAAEAQIKNLNEPVIYVFDRNSNEDYASFSSDSEKVDSISKVFPLFFIAVAALVCLTTMTRMVEENRTQIGTLKALGYSRFSIVSKFLIYGISATTLGCFTGLILGFRTLPVIIFNSYKMLYNIPTIYTPFRWNYALIIYISSLVCVIAVILAVCMNELRSTPAQLMRPKAPPKGKRVLLERVPILWNKLSFLAKVTIRNLFRYKKRFFMTIIGIAGCTALMLTGFGLNNSIASIATKQFDSVFILDGMSAVRPGADINKAQELFNNEYVKESMPCLQTTMDLYSDEGSRNVNVIIPSDTKEIDKYIKLQTRLSGEKLHLDDSGIIINEKLSKLLDLKIGDTVTIQNLEHKPRSVKITGINENYTMHYLYMTPALYNSLYGSTPEYNSIVFNMKNQSSADEKAMAEKILTNKDILGIQYSSSSGNTFFEMTENLNNIVFVLILCAGALAFIVLYNLSNINVNERERELATIKLLGFYDNEVSAYIYRENTVSSFIGMLVGLVLGIILHKFVIVTAEVDIVMFNRVLEWQSFLYAGLLTMMFTLIVNIILHFRLKKINMVESLKSVE